VPDNDWLAEEFETHRSRLRAVAYRMLGSPSEADDAVQESWLRLSRSGPDGVRNLGGWLTTVTARVCLDMLRSRTSRREEPLDPAAPGAVQDTRPGIDPEHEAVLADSVGLAMLVVLDTLAPAERVAFVLHDMFSVPFDQIGDILDRTPNATKQLASRARRRIEGAGTDPASDLARQRQVVGAFLAASRGGDFEALIALLAPDVVLRADAATVQTGAESEVHGADAVARTFAGRARAARLALVDGAAGLVWSQGGQPRVVFGFTLTGGTITGIEMVGDPDRLRQLDVAMLDD
jgi:RNA polymerase sigma-70 factor (ECF subfamily)